jgi:hypothetical protein
MSEQDPAYSPLTIGFPVDTRREEVEKSTTPAGLQHDLVKARAPGLRGVPHGVARRHVLSAAGGASGARVFDGVSR